MLSVTAWLKNCCYKSVPNFFKPLVSESSRHWVAVTSGGTNSMLFFQTVFLRKPLGKRRLYFIIEFSYIIQLVSRCFPTLQFLRCQFWKWAYIRDFFFKLIVNVSFKNIKMFVTKRVDLWTAFLEGPWSGFGFLKLHSISLSRSAEIYVNSCFCRDFTFWFHFFFFVECFCLC